MESWLATQVDKMVLSWEKSIERFYPQHLETWTSPAAHLKALTEQWNTLAAAQYLEWDKYLVGESLKIIDLGAGTGWLSAILSTRENVGQIYALDASPMNLEVMLPALAELMRGNLTKIVPVKGLFTPILVSDNFFDIAVASSSVHHAPDLAEFLSEVYRVLKPGGFFIILNEQPLSSLRYAAIITLRCIKILKTLLLKRWQPISRPISESGVMLDPFLGDRAYCDWQWESAVTSAGFSFQAIETPYYPYQKVNRRLEIRLTHFIAQKRAGNQV